MKKNALIFASIALCITAPPAFSSESPEIWQCRTKTGHKYTASQNVPVDTCTRDRKAELNIKPPPREISQYCDTNPGAICKKITAEEELGTLNGVDYNLSKNRAIVAAVTGADVTYYETITKWRVFCSRDKMSDARSCNISWKDIYINLNSAGIYSISVGDNHFPSSQTSIKINGIRFDTLDKNGNFAQSKKISELLKDESNVVTRYMKWPNRNWIDEEFKIGGMQVSLKLAAWLLKNGKFE